MWSYAKPANAAGFSLGSWYAPTAANVGGRSLTVPTYLPIDRPRALSTLKNVLRLNPAGLLTTMTVQWLLDYGLERVGDQWMKNQESRAPVPGYAWTHARGGTVCKQASQGCTFLEAENAAAQTFGTADRARQGSGAPQYVTTFSNGQVQYSVQLAFKWVTPSNPILDGQVFYEIIQLYGTPSQEGDPGTVKRPAEPADWELVDDLPDTVVQEQESKVPMPVQRPQISPMRVPLGSAVPVPDTDPQQYRQPVLDLIPRNTTNEPWRVEVIPRDLTTQTPLDEPIPLDPESPGEVNPRTGDVRQLCDVYPEILACKELDDVEDPDLEVEEREIELSPGSPWGAAGFCPATRYVANGTIPIPFDLVCQYMEGLRPIIIAMAWLAAGFIVLGVRGGD